MGSRWHIRFQKVLSSLKWWRVKIAETLPDHEVLFCNLTVVAMRQCEFCFWVVVRPSSTRTHCFSEKLVMFGRRMAFNRALPAVHHMCCATCSGLYQASNKTRSTATVGEKFDTIEHIVDLAPVIQVAFQWNSMDIRWQGSTLGSSHHALSEVEEREATDGQEGGTILEVVKHVCKKQIDWDDLMVQSILKAHSSYVFYFTIFLQWRLPLFSFIQLYYLSMAKEVWLQMRW